MMNAISNENKTKKGKIPLWFAVLFSITLFFTLSSFALYGYQKYAVNNKNIVQEGDLYIKKLGILEQDDLIDINWLHTLNPLVKKVQGRLLWSSKKQQGFMELINLPEIKKTQQYRLWIYDLYANDKSVAAVIDHDAVYRKKTRVVMPFTATALINTPFKFELVLEEQGKKAQPLLLAQP